MDVTPIKGSCLCGNVTYQYQGGEMIFQYCHCSRCRKFTSAAHATNIMIDPKHFQWLRWEESVGRYEIPNTKYHATCFCKNCGSSLPWKTQGGESMLIPAGTLDDDPGSKPKHNIFYKSKACWYVSADDLPKYDELPKK